MNQLAINRQIEELIRKKDASGDRYYFEDILLEDSNIVDTSKKITVDYDMTYYAIVDKVGVISKEFCYFPVGSDKNDACVGCENTVIVYFNEVDYNTNGIDNVTWYFDVALTTPTSDGLYKLNEPWINESVIYSLTSGIPTSLGVCGSDPITCVI